MNFLLAIFTRRISQGINNSKCNVYDSIHVERESDLYQYFILFHIFIFIITLATFLLQQRRRRVLIVKEVSDDLFHCVTTFYTQNQ